MKPACKYTPEDASHFDNANKVTIGMTEVSRGMTIEYYPPLDSMIPEESRCSIFVRSKSQNRNISWPCTNDNSVHSMGMPFCNDSVLTDIPQVQSPTPYREALFHYANVIT